MELEFQQRIVPRRILATVSSISSAMRSFFIVVAPDLIGSCVGTLLAGLRFIGEGDAGLARFEFPAQLVAMTEEERGGSDAGGWKLWEASRAECVRRLEDRLRRCGAMVILSHHLPILNKIIHTSLVSSHAPEAVCAIHIPCLLCDTQGY